MCCQTSKYGRFGIPCRAAQPCFFAYVHWVISARPFFCEGSAAAPAEKAHGQVRVHYTPCVVQLVCEYDYQSEVQHINQ
jgi:hypothetical protein